MDRLILGLVPSDRLRARDPRTRMFMHALEDRIGALVLERNVASYEDLERDMMLARIDLAWLPPMVYARLERDGVAHAMLARQVSGPTFWSALVTTSQSKIQRLDQIIDSRIAWVDPLSSSGYLVARLGLRANGIEPRTAFRQQFFAGSHAETINALLEGSADVAATFVHLDEAGFVVRGPWDEMGIPPDRIRVLAVLGAVPPDVLAARVSVPEALRDKTARAIVSMADDPQLGEVISAVFGSRQFAAGSNVAYVQLREMLERANQSGAHHTDAFTSTAPPPTKKG
jgi:phosphate/phosphite/phosphonate ABC transporter binding protein